MDTSKIIIGTVGGGRYTVTAPIVKEDYGLYLKIEGLELPSTYEVDFSNSEHNGTSVTMIGNSDGVLIPSQFISSGKDVFAFLYHVGVDFGRTVYKFRIPNKLRPDRTDEAPTPEEQSVIDQAIAALNNAVEQTAQDVINADASAQSASDSADRAEIAEQDAENAADVAHEYADRAETSASQASASATASAQSASQSAQIKSDVEGMVDDAQASATASAQSASASANSASQASGYAQSASASATNARGYASNAQTSAQTATAKASEASTSAQTASTKASEASGYATTASNKATEASGYATSASQAKTDAESARDLAQGYASSAQGYANDAQASAESISASASQIAQNTADILKAFPTDTASGAVASFTDGADNIPLKNLVVDINPVQDLSNGDPSPENICPISGWTEMQTNICGINLFDKATAVVGYIDDASGQLKTQGAGQYSKSTDYISVKPNVSYYISSEQTRGSWGAWYDKDKNYISGITGYIATASDIQKTKTAPSNAYYMRLTIEYYVTDTVNGNIDTFSINYPSTGHDYHPYTGRSITIDLGQTVYGGKLDVLTGKLVIDRAKYIESGQTTNWMGGSAGNAWRWFADVFNPLATIPTTQSGLSKAMSDKFKATYTVWSDAQTTVGFLHRGARLWIRFGADTELTTAQKVKEWFTANPTEFVYELAEPIEIQLTPHEVNSLLGQNNIFADTGDSAVEYRADTTLYISRLTEPDNDMIADANITSGQYFMVGNSLFKATANIASGASVIVGTNAIRKSLSEALNEINA